MTDRPALGVDIGGTKLAAALVDAAGGVSQRRQRPTPVTTDPEALWSTFAQLVDEVVGATTPAAVGVGCGGPMRWPEGVVSPLNIAAWRDFPLADRLRARFPGLPVVVQNDAVAMAVGEHAFGAGRGSRAFLGVVVSTGVGGGLVLDGTALPGRTGNAGHIGHVVVDADGPDCVCGGRGCLEAVARGPAVVAWAVGQGWQPAAGDADGVALVASARRGDAIARAALTRAGRALGVGLASAAALADLDAVAIGGGLSNAGELLLAPAVAAFERHARLSFTRDCRLTLARLGADAGVVGAGVLARRALVGATN